jgi:hypothetical protein
VNAYELLGQAIGAFCSWLGYIAGRLFRRRVLAATVVVVVIAGGVWMIAAVVPQMVWLWKTVVGGTVALADCKFSIPRKGEVGPACKCRTITYPSKEIAPGVFAFDKGSVIYMPNTTGELIAPNHTDYASAGSNSLIWVYNVSQKYRKYLVVQSYDTVWDRIGFSKVCDRDTPKYTRLCVVGLIAADQIAENSCHYER